MERYARDLNGTSRNPVHPTVEVSKDGLSSYNKINRQRKRYSVHGAEIVQNEDIYKLR